MSPTLGDYDAWLDDLARVARFSDVTVPPISEMTRLTTYVEVEQALKSKDLIPGGKHGKSAPVTKNSLTGVHGNDHFERRRIENVLFKKDALAVYDDKLVKPAIEEVLTRAATQRDPDGVVRADLLILIRHLLLRVSATIAGIDGTGSPEAIERLRGYAEKLSEGTQVDWSTRDANVVMAEALAAKARFIAEFFGPSWSRRVELVAEFKAGRLDEAALPKDLITIMILHQDHFLKWDHDVFVRETQLYLNAGSLSSSTITGHALVELSGWIELHPEDEKRLVDSAFLRDAVLEALRLHQGSPILRQAIRDTTLSTGRQLHAGEYVVIDRRQAIFDASVFGENPERFNPYRGLPPNRAFGFGFGGGPHMCIGKGLAVGDAPEDHGYPAALGTNVRILLEFFRAGLRLDPEKPPCRRTTVVLDEYETLPVRFERL